MISTIKGIVKVSSYRKERYEYHTLPITSVGYQQYMRYGYHSKSVPVTEMPKYIQNRQKEQNKKNSKEIKEN